MRTSWPLFRWFLVSSYIYIDWPGAKHYVLFRRKFLRELITYKFLDTERMVQVLDVMIWCNHERIVASLIVCLVASCKLLTRC